MIYITNKLYITKLVYTAGKEADPMASVSDATAQMQDVFLSAKEVADILKISKPFAYKIIREMNEQLEKEGFLTISGRISKKYFNEKFYGVS